MWWQYNKGTHKSDNVIQEFEHYKQEREDTPLFIPASSFRGSRPGYVFKAGDEGLGYYVDHAQ